MYMCFYKEEFRMKLLLFLAKGVELMEASGFIDVFGWDRQYNKGKIQVVTCGLRKEIISTFNIPLKVELLLEEVRVEDFDAFAIPGGFGEYGFYEDAYSDELLQLIVKFTEQKKPIASVCVGALPLAKAGVLKDRRATTYHLAGAKKQKQLEEFGCRLVADEAIVVEDNIITSWGPSTAAEVAFRLLEILTTKEHVKETRKNMGF